MLGERLKKLEALKKALQIGVAATFLGTASNVGEKSYWDKKSTPTGKIENKKEKNSTELELPEEIKSFIEREKNINRESLEYLIAEGDTNTAELIKNKINLLESEPIKYFTTEIDSTKKTIEFIEQRTEYTAEEKVVKSSTLRQKIEQLQKVLDALKIAKGRETNKPPYVLSMETNLTNLATSTNAKPPAMPEPVTVPKPPTPEEIRAEIQAEFDKKLAEKQAEFNTKLAESETAREQSEVRSRTILKRKDTDFSQELARLRAEKKKSEFVAPQKTKAMTDQELLEAIVAKARKAQAEGKDLNQVLTADEAMIYNIELMRRQSKK